MRTGWYRRGITVSAYTGTTYAGQTQTTDGSGQAAFQLLAGSYRFRVVVNSVSYWSGTSNTCTLPGCSSDAITVPAPVTVSVVNANGVVQGGITVSAYTGTTYAGQAQTTDGSGQAVFQLLPGSYRFKVVVGGLTYWSGTSNTCTLPGCSSDAITVPAPVTVSVTNANGVVQGGMTVYAYSGTTYAGSTRTTDGSGQALFQLLPGSYRFRVTVNSVTYWSGTSNTCTLPGCSSDAISVPAPVTVTVTNASGAAQAGLSVYSYKGANLVGLSYVTNGSGQAVFPLLPGSYRFKVVVGGLTYWSGSSDTCTLPGCSSDGVVVNLPPVANAGQDQSVLEGATVQLDGNGSTDPDNGIVTYEWDLDNDGLYDDATGVAPTTVFGDSGVYPVGLRVTDGGGLSSTDTVVITVLNVAPVGVFHAPESAEAGTSLTLSLSDVSDPSGADVLAGFQYAFDCGDGSGYGGFGLAASVECEAWSSAGQQTVGGKVEDKDGGVTEYTAQVTIIVPTVPVTVSVTNANGAVQAGMTVSAYNGTTYAGQAQTTDGSGQAEFQLLAGSYRFRVVVNSVSYWSGTSNTCTLPGCSSDAITVPAPVTVSVTNANGVVQAGITVSAYTGTTYAGQAQTTDGSGQAVFPLLPGSYRFKVVVNGLTYWSGTSNTCTLPGCSSDAITVPAPVTVSVTNANGVVQGGMTVYAYSGTTYAGSTRTTDGSGQALFQLLPGSYRFRVTVNSVTYWSGTSNTCTLPGCSSDAISVPAPVTVTVTNAAGRHRWAYRYIPTRERTWWDCPM